MHALSPPLEEPALSPRPRHLAAGAGVHRRTAPVLPEAVRTRAPLALFLLAGVLATAALLMIAVAPTTTGGSRGPDASDATTGRPGEEPGDGPDQGFGSGARQTPSAPATAATQGPVDAGPWTRPRRRYPRGSRPGGAGRDRPRG
ncbi:hypothetical protein [Geodermatophilus sp. SYSU D01176]